MRTKILVTLGLLTVGAATAQWMRADAPIAAAAAGPQMTSIGAMTFGPDGVLFAADTRAATIYALELDDKATAGASGTQGVEAIDQKIAGLLGTDAKEIAVTDLAVHPKTKNAFIGVMRGQGAAAQPALVKVDGAGKIALIAMDAMKFTKVDLPNAPNAGSNPQRDPRQQSITDMAFSNGKLYVAGLSNEEFASKLRAVSYPFTGADAGTSVEIFHGNHGQLETRSPVYAFLPYQINNAPHIVAAYLCTPLVTFPVANLQPGTKVVGKTIAELGNRNRPIDMVLYKKDGREFVLMSNTSRGVMKIPTDEFGSASAITERVAAETGGVKYETVGSLKGVEQLDLLDGSRTLVITRGDSGLALSTVPLP